MQTQKKGLVTKMSSVSKDNNFQARSTLVGEEYEKCIEYYLRSQGYECTKRPTIKEIGVEFDFFYELDGVDHYIECKGGKNKTPGAERTDNVKKALANGALLKTIQPNARYIGYFSFPPKPNSRSHYMIEAALKAKYFDEVHYIGYDEVA